METMAMLVGAAAGIVAVFAAGWKVGLSRNGYVKAAQCAAHRAEDAERIDRVHDRITECATGIAAIQGEIRARFSMSNK